MIEAVPQTALITGASAGIGRDLARLFAADGHDVVLVARRARSLDALAAELSRTHAITATPIAADLSRADTSSQLRAELHGRDIAVDVVVNNAGFGLRGPVAELPLERQMAMIQVNVMALTELTRLFLPAMLQRNRGGVLNVASTAAFQPGPLMAVYYATKAYAASFTEALADEVRDSALKVTCLCPGPTETEFAQTAEMTDAGLFKGRTMRSSDVARAGYDGWKRGDVLVVPGLSNRMGTLLARAAPRATMRRIVRGLNASAK
jgi:short-subunit dehydrogenase